MIFLDNKGNIAGGLTLVEWESQKKPEGRPESEGFPSHAEESAQRFGTEMALKAEEKEMTIYCDFKRGPDFNDISVEDHCNTNTGGSTGRAGTMFFTDRRHFQVKEIQVFQITSLTAIPLNPACLRLRDSFLSAPLPFQLFHLSQKTALPWPFSFSLHATACRNPLPAITKFLSKPIKPTRVSFARMRRIKVE
jgi:hypothetical protein